jgi:hypothetical protein
MRMRLLALAAVLSAGMLFGACEAIQSGMDEAVPAEPASEFEIGDTVKLTTESGVCLQTYVEAGFESATTECVPDGTVRTLAEGPVEAADAATGETFRWWGLGEQGGWTIENWMRQ